MLALPYGIKQSGLYVSKVNGEGRKETMEKRAGGGVKYLMFHLL
jgi:hypothetical protein